MDLQYFESAVGVQLCSFVSIQFFSSSKCPIFKASVFSAFTQGPGVWLCV